MPEIEFDSEVKKIGWFSWSATVIEYAEYPRENDSPFVVKTPTYLGTFLTQDRAMTAVEEYLRGIN